MKRHGLTLVLFSFAALPCDRLRSGNRPLLPPSFPAVYSLQVIYFDPDSAPC